MAEAGAKRILDLRGRLLQKGFTVASFARKHGYDRRTVRHVIGRHVGGECQTCRGEIARSILRDIEAIVGSVRECDTPDSESGGGEE